MRVIDRQKYKNKFLTLPFSSAGLSVDLGTVTSGANWLLERQGSGGEWGEVEMFPDLDQVERASKCWGPLKANICWVPNKFLSLFTSIGSTHPLSGSS